MMAQAQNTRVDNRLLLTAARTGWIVLAMLGVVYVFAFLNALHQNYRMPGWPLADLRATADILLWYSTIMTVLTAIIFYGVSAFLIWSRGHERISILMAFFLIALGTSPVDTYTPVVLPDVIAANPFLLWIAPLLGEVAWGGFMLFIMLFPDGQIVPRRGGRLLVAYNLVLISMWNLIPPTSPLFVEYWPPFLFMVTAVSSLSSMLYSMIYRYRKVSTPSQQQQIKWVLYGIIVIILFFMFYFIQTFVLDVSGLNQTRLLTEISRGLAGFFLVLIPITIMIAILQYRLWDIDLIIRRTLSYGAITLLLGAIYFGGVVLLQMIFTQITGGESALAVVASTLLIAAMFTPVRHRVQAFIDRRFYRQKYNLQRTLEQFGDIARDEVNLEEIEQALVNTIHNTMQPEHVSLWLHKTGKEG